MLLKPVPLIYRKPAGRGRGARFGPPAPSIVASVLEVRPVSVVASDAVWTFDTEVVSIAVGGVAGLRIEGVSATGDFEDLGSGMVLVSYNAIVPTGVAWHVEPLSCAITFVDGAVLEEQDGTVVAVPPPVLVGALFEADVPSVTLSFDRPIDVAALVGAAFVVDDASVTVQMYVGTSGSAVDANTVVVYMEATGASSGAGQVLDVAGGNGIVSAGGLGPWEGVEDLALPFP